MVNDMRVRYHNFKIPEVFSDSFYERLSKRSFKSSVSYAEEVYNSSAMLTGSSEVFYLSHAWQADLALRGYDVHVIDCAIRFNPFLLSEEAFRRSLSPEELLTRIKVRRAFTPYQILDAAKEALSDYHEVLKSSNKKEGNMTSLQPSNKYPENTMKKSHAANRKSVYFFLAPCKQFFDGDVAYDEGVFLLEKLLSLYHEFILSDIALIIVEKNSYNHKAFLPIHHKMKELAASFWSLNEGELANGEMSYKLEGS